LIGIGKMSLDGFAVDMRNVGDSVKIIGTDPKGIRSRPCASSTKWPPLEWPLKPDDGCAKVRTYNRALWATQQCPPSTLQTH
jgi:hypothetical protein